ncbi:MAG: hypothetical protein SFV81_06605 [Pirellulaceae bacterium]|nr:hypothetical protein [Pirellulaceae bacterium]
MQTVKNFTTVNLKQFILGSFLVLASDWHAVASAQELEQTFSTQLSELKTKVERLEAAVKEISSGKPEGIKASSPDAAMDMKSKGGKGIEADKAMEAGKAMDMDGQKSQAKQDGKGVDMKGMDIKEMTMGNDGGMPEKKSMGAMSGNEAAMGSSALVPIDSRMIQMQMIKMKMMEMK